MDKEFEKFCSRVKKEREGVPVRAKYADWIVEESLRWAMRLSVAEVAAGIGITDESINRWRRVRQETVQRMRGTPDARARGEGIPAVVNVTRVTVGARPDAPRVLARLVRGEISIDFFDEGALAQNLSGVLS
jgi:hypothetical protein